MTRVHSPGLRGLLQKPDRLILSLLQWLKQLPASA